MPPARSSTRSAAAPERPARCCSRDRRPTPCAPSCPRSRAPAPRRIRHCSSGWIIYGTGGWLSTGDGPRFAATERARPRKRARSRQQARTAEYRVLRSLGILRGRVADRRLDGELPVLGELHAVVDAQAFQQKEPSGAGEARLGGQPDLVVDPAPLEVGLRSLVEPRQDSHPEREVVDQLRLDPDQLVVALVDPCAAGHLLEDLARV